MKSIAFDDADTLQRVVDALTPSERAEVFAERGDGDVVSLVVPDALAVRVQAMKRQPHDNTAALLSHAAAIRWKRQSAGIDVNGLQVRTDDATRAALAAAALVAQLQPAFKTDWKFADGTFSELDAAKLETLTLAVAQHVSASIAWEKAARVAILAGTVTSFAAIESFKD